MRPKNQQTPIREQVKTKKTSDQNTRGEGEGGTSIILCKLYGYVPM